MKIQFITLLTRPSSKIYPNFLLKIIRPPLDVCESSKGAEVERSTEIEGVQPSMHNTNTAHRRSYPSLEIFVMKRNGHSALDCHVLQCSENTRQKGLAFKMKSERSHDRVTDCHRNGTKTWKGL